MNIVFLSALLGRARPLAAEILRTLSGEHRLHALLRVEPTRGGRSFRKLRGKRWGQLAMGVERRLFYQPYLAHRDRRLEARFPSVEGMLREIPPEALTRGTTIPAADLNTRATADLLSSLQADLLLVCGAPLLTPEVFEAPRLGTVNVHWGISPNYRGEDTEFWPWYHADWDNLGATLHRIDRGIDTGEVLAHVFPELDRSDSNVTLLEKMGRRMAPVVNEFLRDPTRRGTPQKEMGRPSRVYLGRDRHVWHDVRFQFLRALGALRPPARDARIVRYYDRGTIDVGVKASDGAPP